jgi:HEAT repeat protein
MLRRRLPVARLERHRDVAGLVRALAFRDVIVDSAFRRIDLGAPTRADAAAALGRLSEPQAIGALAAALSDEYAAVRRNALNALAGFHEPEAVDALADAGLSLTTPDPVLQAEAAAVLEARAAVDGQIALRVAARYLDGEAEDESAGLEMLAGVVGRVPDPAQRAAIATAATQRLDHDDPARRRRAARLLAAVPDARAGAVAAALRPGNANPETAWLLGELRELASTPVLLEMLSSKDPAMRRSAAQALERVLDPRAVEGLLQAAADADPGVRDAAVRALRALGPAGTLYGFAAIARSLTRDLEPGQRGPDLAHLLEVASQDRDRVSFAANAESDGRGIDVLTSPTAEPPKSADGGPAPGPAFDGIGATDPP